MPLYTFDVRVTILTIRYETGYTLGRLRAHRRTIALASPFESLLTKCSEAAAQEQLLEDNVVFARARIDSADDELDSFVDDTVTLVLKQNEEERTALTRALLGGKRPSAIKRPILGSELEHVRGWSALLRAAPSEAIKALAAACDSIVELADGAVASLIAAETALRTFRALAERPSLVNEANLVRKTAYGALNQMPHQPANRDLPVDFAEKFFLHNQSPAPATQKEVRADIAAKEEELTDLRKKLAALEAREAEVQAAEAARESARTELEQAEELAAQAAARVAELRTKAGKR